jgi:hypothetical protein
MCCKNWDRRDWYLDWDGVFFQRNTTSRAAWQLEKSSASAKAVK